MKLYSSPSHPSACLKQQLCLSRACTSNANLCRIDRSLTRSTSDIYLLVLFIGFMPRRDEVNNLRSELANLPENFDECLCVRWSVYLSVCQSICLSVCLSHTLRYDVCWLLTPLKVVVAQALRCLCVCLSVGTWQTNNLNSVWTPRLMGLTAGCASCIGKWPIHTVSFIIQREMESVSTKPERIKLGTGRNEVYKYS